VLHNHLLKKNVLEEKNLKRNQGVGIGKFNKKKKSRLI
jgi:hypothetical protein